MRGSDSTGVFCVENNGDVHIAKDALNGPAFIDKREAEDVFTTALTSGLFLVGHNRAATRGAVVDRNAHPFWVDNRIVLVQNGTWVGDHKHVKDTEVDTEAVAHIIAGEEDVQKALKQINAAYALVWYDVKKQALHMIRNKERPLWIARTEDDGLVFASEPSFITFACARAELTLKETPYLLDEDNLVTVTKNGRSWELDNKKVSTKYSAPKQQSTISKGAVAVVQAIQTVLGKAPTSVGSGNVCNPAHQQHVSRVVKEDSLNIHSYVHRASFTDWHIKDEQTARQMQAEFTTKSHPVNLEMVDYLAAASGKDCRDWHIIFTEVTTERETGPVFYATMKDTAEEDILKRINKPFCAAKVGNPIIHVLKDMVGNREFVTLVRITEFVKHEEDAHTQVTQA